MKPIPRKLLIHRASIRPIEAVDRWGKVILGNSQEMKFIRLEPFSKVLSDKQNTQVQKSCTLFYDCKNSLPRGFTFTKDMVITAENIDYRVQTIEPLYDENELHHYEIGLV